MNTKHLLANFDKDLRIHHMLPEARREVNGDVVRFIRQAPGMNYVAFTFATERTLPRVIAQEVAYLSPFAQPFTWKVYEHDQLAGLRGQLTAQGFVEDNDPAAVMALDLRHAPAETLQADPGIDIRRITTRDGLKTVVDVLKGVYGGNFHWVYNRMGAHLAIPGYLSVYAAYHFDIPVSVAWTYFPQGRFATLFGGSTLPAHRQRGYYTALLAHRLHEIRVRGYAFAVVEAGEMSRPIVARYGFQQVSTVWDYEWQRQS